jgi:hypothetical protein
MCVSVRPSCFGARLRTPRWVPADKLDWSRGRLATTASMRPSANRSLYKIDHPLSESLEAWLANAGRHPLERWLTEPAVTNSLNPAVAGVKAYCETVSADDQPIAVVLDL